MNPHLGVSFLSQMSVKIVENLLYLKLHLDNVAHIEFGTNLLVIYRPEFLKSAISAIK